MAPGVTSADAMSNDARGMYVTLSDAGHEVSLFTPNGISATPWDTFSYADALWKLDQPDDLVIYHYCTADNEAFSTLRQLHCRAALKYHNVTPSVYMAPYSSFFASLTRHARAQLNEFGELSLDWLLGDSNYNLDEIGRVTDGRGRYVRLPPFTQVNELLYAKPEPATAEYMGRFPLNIVTVGRIAPNKGHERMLRAFGIFMKNSKVRPHLHIVGAHDPRLSSYVSFLRGIIAQGDIADYVTFHPVVGTPALAGYYRGSQFFWTASHHEGFCVPVIEAMALGVPVLSSSAGALRETCGNAARLADTEQEMVNALHDMVNDDELLATLKRDGKRRYAEMFSNARVGEQFLAFMTSWHDEVRNLASNAADAAAWRPQDWMRLPSAKTLVEEALRHNPALGAAGLYARDQRLDLLRWALSAGREHSEFLARYAPSAELARYAASLEMPPAAGRLTPAERLVWTVSRREQERFPMTREGVANFRRWLAREGATLFGLTTRSVRLIDGSGVETMTEPLRPA